MDCAWLFLLDVKISCLQCMIHQVDGKKQEYLCISQWIFLHSAKHTAGATCGVLCTVQSEKCTQLRARALWWGV
jgi:hypothetical protein